LFDSIHTTTTLLLCVLQVPLRKRRRALARAAKRVGAAHDHPFRPIDTAPGLRRPCVSISQGA
jgi:hypothetical protein